MPSAELDERERAALLETARRSIEHWLEHDEPLGVDPARASARLRREGAAFVTLLREGRLRGCIGTLEPTRPLVVDVASNAVRAAGRDPRFPPVRAGELGLLHIEISVLSPRTPVVFDDETELIAQLRAGVDGLVIRSGEHSATFLPSVWEKMPDAATFLRELKRKAGLGEAPCPDLSAWRYTTQAFAESLLEP